MNEKFFDLKKEKQDRMINAALKVFGMRGYQFASTDDIVREAGISKGLLFHYFGSKLGLYSFVYDYSVRFMSLELKAAVDDKETDFFALHKILENFMLTYGGHLGYNLKMQGLSPKGGTFYAENVSAQEAP